MPQTRDEDKKDLPWKDEDGPDDFLKYFISITAEKKTEAARG